MFGWFLLIAASLLLGIVIGAKQHLPAAVQRRSAKVTTAGLLLLLWAMGAQIGTDREILANISSLGAMSLVLAAGAIAGSVLFLYLGEKLLLKKEKDEA